MAGGARRIGSYRRGRDETLGTARRHSGRMSEPRAEEKVVAATLTTTLGLKVEQHDDGKQPGMPLTD